MSKAETYNSKIIDELFDSISPEEEEKIRKRMLLAARIDKAIKAKGWKKKDLAEALKKRRSEITRWLSGTHNFNTDTLFDIERVLNIGLVTLKDVPKEQVIRFTLGFSQTVETANSSPLGGILFGKSSVDIYQGEKSSFYAGSSNNKC